MEHCAEEYLRLAPTKEAELRGGLRRAKENLYDTEMTKLAIEEEIQLIVEKAMDKKLRPIYSMLARIQQKGHSITDILSGIGYILGLVGVGAYFHYRKKSKEPSSP